MYICRFLGAFPDRLAGLWGLSLGEYKRSTGAPRAGDAPARARFRLRRPEQSAGGAPSNRRNRGCVCSAPWAGTVMALPGGAACIHMCDIKSYTPTYIHYRKGQIEEDVVLEAVRHVSERLRVRVTPPTPPPPPPLRSLSLPYSPSGDPVTHPFTHTASLAARQGDPVPPPIPLPRSLALVFLLRWQSGCA